MHIATMEEVQAHLPEILDQLSRDQEVVITRDGVAVAKLAPAFTAKQPRVPGRGKGKIIVHVDDDEHLKDFQDYMP